MSALVPCTACRRHIRSHEARCCFCGAERTAAPARQVALPRGVKRATLFALSVTLAGQACAGENDVPIYGAPVPPGVGGTGGGGGSSAGGSGAGGNAGSVNTGGNAGTSIGNPVPVYGAPVAPEGGSTGLPDPVVDAGTDAGDDAG